MIIIYDYFFRKYLSKYSFKWENCNIKIIVNIFYYLCYSNSWGFKFVSGNFYYVWVRDWVY